MVIMVKSRLINCLTFARAPCNRGPSIWALCVWPWQPGTLSWWHIRRGWRKKTAQMLFRFQNEKRKEISLLTHELYFLKPANGSFFALLSMFFFEISHHSSNPRPFRSVAWSSTSRANTSHPRGLCKLPNRTAQALSSAINARGINGPLVSWPPSQVHTSLKSPRSICQEKN